MVRPAFSDALITLAEYEAAAEAAITQGNTPRLEMLAVEPGPVFDLASGVDWQIKIGSRGGWMVCV
jgi:hypothetical protein